jgi:preprotein translocase subunit SecE
LRQQALEEVLKVSLRTERKSVAMADVKTMDSPESFGTRLTSVPTRVKEYVEELQTEMRRVTWPSWKQVRATTTVVVVSVFLFAGYFAIVDTIIGRVINKLFAALAK